MSYLEQSNIDSMFTEFERIYNDNSDWEEVCVKRDVRVVQKYYADDPHVVLKGTGVIAAPYREVLERLKDVDRKGEWDLFYESGRQIRQIDDKAHSLVDTELSAALTLRQTAIGYFCTKSSMVTWARDFALLASGREIPEEQGGGVLFVGKSFVDEELVPEVSGYVRGTIKVAGYRLVPNEGKADETHITYIFQVDVAGWLPNSVVNMVNTYQPLSIIGLRKVLTGTTIHPPSAAQ